MNSRHGGSVGAIRIALFFCMMLFPQAATAQGGVRYFGSPCGLQPPLGNPKILVNGFYTIGNFFSVGVTNMGVVPIQYQCWYGGTAYLFLGASDQSMGGIPLPFLLPMSLTQGWPCSVYASADFLWGSVPLTAWPPGGNGMSLLIPNDARLIGQKLFLQWAVLYGTAGLNCLPWPGHLWYLITSDAAEVTIGR